MLTSTRNVALACALSALAGYLDGIGFIHLGGLFVSFMSGNSTRLGVSLSDGHWAEAAAAAGLIALFVGGAAIGSLIVSARLSRRQAIVLFVEAALLALAAIAAALGAPNAGLAAIVTAMGLENAVFQGEGGAGLGLTYMTGALVKVGQLLAAALLGGPRFAWLPNAALWAALVAGAVLGALAYHRLGLASIWFATAAALALGVAVAVAPPRPARGA